MLPLLAVALAQARTWTPPQTTLPRPFVEATAFLLAHGMGDPRGGEFGEATVATKDRRTGKPLVVRGWMFPQEVPSRVVTIGGLVYPVTGIQKRIDPTEIVASRTAARSTEREERPDSLFAALLLIAGKADLAAELLKSGDERYLAERMLQGLLQEEGEQAKDAFAQGDDALAERFAWQTVEQRDAFEREAKRLVPIGHIPENFDLGGQLMEKIAVDAARRAGRSRPPLDFAALINLPEWRKVSVLIDYLDEARATGTLIDGGADPAADPIVKALIAIGEPAIGPLINCVEEDRRLTRVGQMTSADWFTIYEFVPVKRAAYRAVQKILKIRGLPSPDDGPGLQRFWSENQSRAPGERWLKVLQDDSAGLEAWREVVENLFGRANGRVGQKPVGVGTLSEAERKTLVELLVRRTMGREASGAQGYALTAPLDFARDLALLSPDRALPSLQVVTRRAMAPGVDLSWAGASFAGAMERRSEIEGVSAWHEYADWIERMVREGGKEGGIQAFRPLVNHQDLPQIRQAMRALFASKESAWSIVPNKTNVKGWWWWSREILLTPFLDDLVFRNATLEALADRTPIGTVAIGDNGSISLKYENGSSGWVNQRVLTDRLRPYSNVPQPIRVGDQVAMALVQLKGAPPYQPYWRERERDKAIENLREFVRKNTGRLKTLLPPRNENDG